MKKTVLLTIIAALASGGISAQGGGNSGGGNSGGGGGGTSSSVSYSNGASLVITSAGTYSGETYTQTGSDYNVVKDTVATASVSRCTLTKSGDTSFSGDQSSFYGTNASVYCSSKGVLTISDCNITSSADGANGIFAYNGGTIYAYRDTITNSDRRSRGLHCTGGNGAYIYAEDCYIVTKSETSSVIATDRGGGTVYVDGGYYEANGGKCAIIYSTGTMTVKNASGASNNSNEGEIADIEGDNIITIDSCTFSCGGSSRGVMLYQSGSGDASGYNPTMNISNSTLTLTNSSAAFCEVSTAVNAYLTLDNCTLTVPSGQLAYINTNSNWSNSNTKYLNLKLLNGSYSGTVDCDDTGTMSVTVGSGSTWVGGIDNDQNTSKDTVIVSGIWSLSEASCPAVLIINSGATVYTNGYTLSYSKITNNGTLSEGTYSCLDGVSREEETASAAYDLTGRRSAAAKGVTIEGGRKILR